VRELENILERAIALCAGEQIEVDDLQLTAPAQGETALVDRSGLPLQEHLDSVEKEAILKALEQTRYNRTAAAKLLGITFRALRYRMERLGIN
jgi:two-component system response regulator PilR (NtrC family)